MSSSVQGFGLYQGVSTLLLSSDYLWDALFSSRRWTYPKTVWQKTSDGSVQVRFFIPDELRYAAFKGSQEWTRKRPKQVFLLGLMCFLRLFSTRRNRVLFRFNPPPQVLLFLFPLWQPLNLISFKNRVFWLTSGWWLLYGSAASLRFLPIPEMDTFKTTFVFVEAFLFFILFFTNVLVYWWHY